VRTATEVQFALANTVERAAGLVDRIVERRNGLAEAVEEPIAGRPPAELRAEADAAAGELAAVEQEVARTAARLEGARDATRRAEQARRAHEQAAAAEARRRAEARERLIRWEGEVAALRASLSQSDAEQGRLESQLQAQDDRAAELRADIAAVTADIQRLDAVAPGLADAVAALQARRSRLQQVARDAAKAERDLERRRASLEARADALFAASADPGQGGAAVADAAEDGRLRGVLGPLAALLRVDDGFAPAVSAALGPLGDALVVEGRSAAEAALALVEDAGAGRVLLLVATAPHVVPAGEPSLDAIGASPLGRAVHGPHDDLPGPTAAAVEAAVRRALAGVYVCDDAAAAHRLADSRPELVFVTRDGHVAGARGHAGGGAAAHTGLLSRAAAEEARAQAEALGRDLGIAHRKVGDAERELEAVREELDAASAAMQESDAQITSAAERLGRLRKELARCDAERGQVRDQLDQLGAATRARRDALEALQLRGPEPHTPDPRFAGAEDGGAGDVEAERLEDALVEAREHEVQARLAAGAAAQQADELRRRVAGLRAEADRVEAQLADRQRRQDARMAAMARCDQLEALARTVHVAAQTSRAAAAAERDRLEEARAEQQRAVGAVRARVAELDRSLAELKDVRHREELVRQELAMQVDAARQRLAALGVEDAEAAVAARGPELLGGGEARDAELAAAEDDLARKLALLGAVNPLALQEFTALQERHAFMTAQLEDLRASRRDLLRVVEVVDERIREVFAAAFADVAAEFERIFPMLFPGGTGRLVLTDAADLLGTGIEVEARPPGKRVKRLSLLSGGERSLTALAFLFAIFAARPSPFYVLDEVEAALDDANLQRFLDLLAAFRESSQWIVVTHQRRTMEIADTVYGVSMSSEGVSRVISRKLADSGLVREAG
jgi:chromosome segregation protein